MSEPAGLGLSLDDLIKRSSTAHRKHEGGAKREGVPPIGVKGGGVVKRSTAPAPRSFNNSAAGRNGNAGARPGGRGGAAAFTGPNHASFANNNSERASFVPSKLDTSYDDVGALNIRLKDTNIVSVAPNGTITLTSGGWKTPTTLNCINRVLNLIGASIGSQGAANDGNWQVSVGTVLTRFEDGMKLPSKGHITANRAQLIYDGLQPGAAPPQGRPQHAPAFSNGAGNRNNGAGFQQHSNNNNSHFRAGGAGGFDNRRNGQQQQQANGGSMHANGASGGGFNNDNGFKGGGSSAGASMGMNDPAVAAAMAAGFRMGVQRSMAAAAGGGMGNSMMGMGGMGMGGMGMGGMGMGMSGMGMGMNGAGLGNMGHSLGSMYDSASAAAAVPQALQAATFQPSRQQYDRARATAAAAAAAAAAGGGLDMMDDDQAVAPMQQQHQQRLSGVRSGNVFNRLTAGVVGGGGQMMDGQSSEEARRLRAQGRYAY